MGTRLLLLTGAGGAGTTTFAAAAALAAAFAGSRTLLLSQEPAGVLEAVLQTTTVGGGPAFRVPLSDGDGGLWVAAADIERETAATWRALQPWLAEAANALGMNQPDPALLSMLPAHRLLATLLHLPAQINSGLFEAIVVDAGQAEPLADWLLLLLALPPLEEHGADSDTIAERLGRPLLRRVAGLPLPDSATRRELRRFAGRLVAGCGALTSAPTTCWVAARTGEASARALRPALARLALAGVPLDGVLTLSASRAGNDERLRNLYAPLRHLPVPHLGDDITGPTLLTMLGKALEGSMRHRDTDHAESGVMRTGTDWELRLPLPFVAAPDLRILQDGPRVTVAIPGGQRTLRLPDALADRACTGARIEDGILRLRFPSGAPD